MAIPLIIGGLSLLAGAYGAKKGLDAKSNYDRAEEIVSQAQEKYEAVAKKLERQRGKTAEQIKVLGELRLTTDAVQIRRFVDVVRQVHDVSHKPIQSEDVHIETATPDLQCLEISSYQAADVLKDGITAVTSGVLTGIGASGLATSIGVASTGTAISTLSGAAATNATLAWLGGGSLASGGLGVAGGTAVLGGAIAGPAIAVMGFAAAKKSERALTEAYEHELEIDVAVEQMKNGISVLKAISKRTKEVCEATKALVVRLEGALEELESLLLNKQGLNDRLSQEKAAREEGYKKRNLLIRILNWLFRRTPDYSFPDPLSYENFSDDEQQLYMITLNLGYALHGILKVQILDDAGDLSDESAEALSATKDLIEA